MSKSKKIEKTVYYPMVEAVFVALLNPKRSPVAPVPLMAASPKAQLRRALVALRAYRKAAFELATQERKDPMCVCGHRASEHCLRNEGTGGCDRCACVLHIEDI